MKLNTCQYIIDHLAQIGVKHIFGITGDALNAFTAAIRINKKIKWITVRHEECAAFAASAQAELTSELAVCVGTIGPGAIHLINGLYNAKRDKAPVLVITGQVPRNEYASRYFQETNQQKLFDDVCVFSESINSKNQLPRILHQAINAAITQKGVAHLAIPTDITLETIDVNKSKTYIYPSTANISPKENELQQVAKLINRAKRVSLLVGCGCRGARSEVIKLATTLQAPVAHTLKGTDVLPFSNPYSIGGVGHVGTPHGMAVLDNCDLLLMLGTDFPYTAFLPKHGNIIQINIDSTHIGTRNPIKMGLHGDVKTTIPQLLGYLTPKQDSSHLTILQEKRDKWVQRVNQKFDPEKSKKVIHPQSVVLTMSELVNDDAIFVGEVGEVTVWAARHLRMKDKQRLIGSYNHGSLGVGLPAAIGAKLAFPKRQVIGLCGDGAFSMLMGDFVTAVHYDIPILIIVLNNSKYGFVELEMEAAGYPRYATELVNPDFAKVAQACGGVGITIKNPKHLRQGLEQALATNKPTIVDVFVNPSELIIPPQIDIKNAWLFTQGKIKEMLIEKDIKVLFER